MGACMRGLNVAMTAAQPALVVVVKYAGVVVPAEAILSSAA
jgi:hypothetical protein